MAINVRVFGSYAPANPKWGLVDLRCKISQFRQTVYTQVGTLIFYTIKE